MPRPDRQGLVRRLLLVARHRPTPECGREPKPVAFSQRDWLERAAISDAPLDTLGIRPRDIIRIRVADGSETALEFPEP